MGNVKTKRIKLLSEKLIQTNPGKFSTDFEENKKLLDEMMTFQSITIRNKVAGYITHSVEKMKKLDSLKVTYQNPNPDKNKKGRKRR